MNRKLIAVTLLAGIVLFLISFYFFPVNELVHILKNVDANLYLTFFVAALTTFLLLNLRWYIICRQHGLRIPYFRLLGYRFAGFSLSIVTPGPKVGGEPVRAGMLSHDTGDFEEALSTVIADKTIELISYAIVIVLALGIAFLLAPVLLAARYGVTIITATLLILIIYSITHILRGNDPLIKLMRTLRITKIPWVNNHMDAIMSFEKRTQKYYSEDKSHFWIAFSLSMITWVFSFLEYWLLLKAIGIHATLPELFIVYGFMQIAYLLPFPLAIGSAEIGQAGAFAAIKEAAAAGVALSLLNRLRDVIWMFIGFIVLGYYAITRKKK